MTGFPQYFEEDNGVEAQLRTKFRFASFSPAEFHRR